MRIGNRKHGFLVTLFVLLTAATAYSQMREVSSDGKAAATDSTKLQRALDSSRSINYPAGWQLGEGKVPSLFEDKVKWDSGSGIYYIYYRIPTSNIVVMDFTEYKPGAQSMDEFIRDFVDNQLKTKNPALQVLPMDSMPVSNSKNEMKGTAFMRAFSNTGYNTYEVAAFIPNGLTVAVVVASAPSYEDFKDNSAPYFNVLSHHVNLIASNNP